MPELDYLRCADCGQATKAVLNCWCRMVVCLACYEGQHRQHKPQEATT